MTRAARASEMIRVAPLAATRRPVSGPGCAVKALVSDPMERVAMPMSVQRARRARRWAGLGEGIVYIPMCCLAGVTAMRIVRAMMKSSSRRPSVIATGRRRQYRSGLRSTNGRMTRTAKKASSP